MIHCRSRERRSFLDQPNVGLMIWTLIVFGVSLLRALEGSRSRAIAEALDKRQHMIEESIDAAERTASEADELLAEYRERLSDARGQADEIVARARRTADAAEHETLAEARRQARGDDGADPPRHRGRDAPRDPARSAPRSPTSRCWPPRRSRASRSTPTTSGGSSRRRSPSSTSARSPDEEQPLAMEEIATVYARSLFEVAQEQRQARRRARAARRSSPTRSTTTRELQVFFFSPYFSTAEKEDGLDRAVSDADPSVVNFLKLLIENHRMPVIFRVRRDLRHALGAGEPAAAGDRHLGRRARPRRP